MKVRTTKSISSEQGWIWSTCLFSPAKTPSATVVQHDDAIGVLESDRVSCKSETLVATHRFPFTYSISSFVYLPSIFKRVVANKITRTVDYVEWRDANEELSKRLTG